MKYIATLAMLAVTLLGACNTKNEAADGAQPQTGAPAVATEGKRDVSTATLVAIDPEIKSFDEAVATAKSAYDKQSNDANKTALIDAYMRFADYMQYESPVSPRQGKYHRALIEYRHVLELDPANEKAEAEIKQIEDIYRSMGREIPGEESM